MKICSKCGKEKPEDQFYWNKKPNGERVRRPDCKDCYKRCSTRASNNEANAVYMRAWRMKKKAGGQ